MLRSLTILLALSLTACATIEPEVALPVAQSEEVRAETARQQDAALTAEQIRFERVQRVWQRLIIANADLCAAQGRAPGFTLHSLNSYPEPIRDAAQRRFGIGADPAVDFISEASPAYAAGLRAHDEIAAVNGRAVREGRLNRPRQRGDRAVQDASDKIDEALKVGGPLTLTIRRGGEAREIAFEPAPACQYRLAIVRDDRVNAAANGEVVAVTTGILRYVQTDSELALVLGHELGHNALEHRRRHEDATRPGAWGGTVLGVVLGAATGIFIDFGQMAAHGSEEMRLTFEREADYAGLYYVARAGFEVDGVEEFWRRFAADYPMSTYLTDTHPTTGERFLNIAAARREIAAKRAAGEDLRPNPAPNPAED